MIDKLSSMPLERFRQAQTGEGGPSFASALGEIQAGHKRSHWVWYVLPQLAGLGHSAMAQSHGIADLAEAKAYIADPVLGPRLAEITGAIEQQLQAGETLKALLGDLNARKAVSSLTLFEREAQDSAATWIRRFLASAGCVLRTADAQGLSLCGLTLARVRPVPPQL